MPEPSATRPRAVLFDLDGTLLDTLEDIARSANVVLEEQGFPPHPPDAYRQFIGDGVGYLFQRAFPAGVPHDDPALVARCVEGFRETYGRGWNVATRPYTTAFPSCSTSWFPVTRHGRALEQARHLHSPVRGRVPGELAVPGGFRRSRGRSAQARSRPAPWRRRAGLVSARAIVYLAIRRWT